MSSILRPEARAIGLETFDITQLEAAERLSDFLQQAVDKIKPQQSKADHLPKWLDTDRSNRTVFLSGDRGTGKTTLLASLIKISLDRAYNKDQPTNNNIQLADKKRHKVTDLETVIAKFCHRIVWLEPLDIEPIPKSCNLLSAILVRVEDVVTGEANRDREFHQSDNAQGLFDAGPGHKLAVQKLKRLQQDVAKAWNGNLDSRKRALDTDSYALEVADGERARLNLNGRLKEVLDELAKENFNDRAINDPLFVLPVDDLDLNPVVCLELLRLLRSMVVPRLFVIVLGDMKGVETIVNLAMAAELAYVEGMVMHREELPVPVSAIGARAGAIAGNALQKLLPPAQRIRLRSLTLAEALSFRPFGSRNYETLAELLAHIPLFLSTIWESKNKEQSQNPADTSDEQKFCSLYHTAIIDPDWDGGCVVSLLSFFLALRQRTFSSEDDFDIEGQENAWKGKDEAIGAVISHNHDLERCPYTALDLLASSPRQVLDLWQEFSELREATQLLLPRQGPSYGPDRAAKRQVTNKLMELVSRRCLEELAADPAFTPEQRAEVLEAFYQDRNHVWTMEKLPIKVVSKPVTWHEEKLVLPGVGFGDQELLDPIGRSRAKYSPEEHLTFVEIMRLPQGQISNIKASEAELQNLEIYVFADKDWHFRVEQPSDQESGGKGGGNSIQEAGRNWDRELGNSARAALVLYHDLAVLTNSGVSNDLLKKMQGEHWQIEAVWRDEFGGKTYIPWPLIPCLSFWDYDRFLKTWKLFFDRGRGFPGQHHPKKPEEEMEYLFFIWMSGCIAMLDKKTPIIITQLEDAKVPTILWESLRDRLGELVERVAGDAGYRAHPSSSVDHQAREWLLDSAQMAMPESGLPHSVALNIFSNKYDSNATKGLAHFWNNNKPWITRRRAERLANFSDEGMERLGATFADKDQSVDYGVPEIANRFVPSNALISSMVDKKKHRRYSDCCHKRNTDEGLTLEPPK